MSTLTLKQQFLNLDSQQIEALNKCHTPSELYDLAKQYIKTNFSLDELHETIKEVASIASSEHDLINTVSVISQVIAENPSLNDELSSVKDLNGAYAIMKPYLGNITETQFLDALKGIPDVLSLEHLNTADNVKNELTDDALDAVVGGSWESFWKGFCTGFMDTLKIIGSAAMIVLNVWSGDMDEAKKWIKPLNEAANHLSNAIKNGV